MNSLPFWYKAVPADEGMTISIEISGDSGGRWLLARQSSKWQIEEYSVESANTISLTEDTAWRFFTRSLAVDTFTDKIHLSGDQDLL